MNREKSIIIVSATINEIIPFLDKCKIIYKDKNLYKTVYNNKNIDFLITGIGIHSTIYYFTKYLHNCNYDYAINAGIAGSFNSEINVGNVVNVVSELFSEFGVDDNGNFKTIFESGVIQKNVFPFTDGKLINPNSFNNPSLSAVENVNAITVNTVHGSKISISEVVKKFNPDIETMEGAAFFYVCLLEELKFIEFRAISNMVVPRKRGNWHITLAIRNLNNELINFINSTE